MGAVGFDAQFFFNRRVESALVMRVEISLIRGINGFTWIKGRGKKIQVFAHMLRIMKFVKILCNMAVDFDNNGGCNRRAWQRVLGQKPIQHRKQMREGEGWHSYAGRLDWVRSTGGEGSMSASIECCWRRVRGRLPRRQF
jgi:hypothetical protein